MGLPVPLLWWLVPSGAGLVSRPRLRAGAHRGAVICSVEGRRLRCAGPWLPFVEGAGGPHCSTNVRLSARQPSVLGDASIPLQHPVIEAGIEEFESKYKGSYSDEKDMMDLTKI